MKRVQPTLTEEEAATLHDAICEFGAQERDATKAKDRAYAQEMQRDLRAIIDRLTDTPATKEGP